MFKSAFVVLSFVLFASVTQAQAGGFRATPAISIAPQVSQTPGMLDVVVTFNVSCSDAFVGLETTVTNTDTNNNGIRLGVSNRVVGVRVIVEDTGRRCQAIQGADRRQTASFQVANVGRSVTFQSLR